MPDTISSNTAALLAAPSPDASATATNLSGPQPQASAIPNSIPQTPVAAQPALQAPAQPAIPDHVVRDSVLGKGVRVLAGLVHGRETSYSVNPQTGETQETSVQAKPGAMMTPMTTATQSELASGTVQMKKGRAVNVPPRVHKESLPRPCRLSLLNAV
jgi:hypothetical protein